MTVTESKHPTGTVRPAPRQVVAQVVVADVRRISPAFVRVWLTGPEVAEIGVDGPLLDQRIKLVFPGTAGLPSLGGEPDDWYAAWSALPPARRGHLRTYTVRALEGEGAGTRLVIDIVVHDGPAAELGPGCRWAQQASPGDRLLLVAPRRGVPFGGIEWNPGRAGRVLLVGDETAAPAIASILESAPLDTAGTAYIEVPGTRDVLDVRTPPGLRLVWLPRTGLPHGQRTMAAVSALFGMPVPPGLVGTAVDDLWETPAYSSSGEATEDGAPDRGLYAWVAGESTMVTALRRLLVHDVGLPRRQVAFMGYWRRGVAMRG